MGKLFSFLRMSKVNLWFMPLAALLSFFQSMAVMYSTCLLFPLAQGIISNDFSHVRHLRLVGTILDHLPWFTASSTRLFIFLVFWIYLMTILRNVFRYLSFLCTQFQSKLATAKVRQLLVVKCLSFGKDFYDKNTISYLQSVLTKSTSLIENQFKLFSNLTTQIFLLSSYLIVMMVISWQLTCLTMVFFPLITFLTHLLSKNIAKASEEHHRTAQNLNDKIFNMLYCMPVIKSFVKERDEVQKFAQASDQEIEQSFQQQRISSLAAPIEDMGSMTGILLIALGIAGFLHAGKGIGASNAFIFFYLCMRVMPLINVFNHFKLGAAGSASALHDIEHVLNQPDSATIQGGHDIFTGVKERISFKDLSFRYTEQGPLVLDKINFDVEKNSVVAIVGPSGSGKTTLVSLLLRFYDCPEGAILIDGTDIRHFDVATLRKQIAFVSQEVLLFNDTVRNNIVYGADSNVSDNDLRGLSEKVAVHDFVDKLPDKYDTHVGERGARLSGGERQRLSIARAIMKDPQILIMDEATSALDSGTETRINDFLSEISSEKTLIIIAHRLSTIKRADKVVYIDKGRVVEAGTLQVLIDKKSAFFRLWQAQKL